MDARSLGRAGCDADGCGGFRRGRRVGMWMNEGVNGEGREGCWACGGAFSQTSVSPLFDPVLWLFLQPLHSVSAQIPFSRALLTLSTPALGLRLGQLDGNTVLPPPPQTQTRPSFFWFLFNSLQIKHDVPGSNFYTSSKHLDLTFPPRYWSRTGPPFVFETILWSLSWMSWLITFLNTSNTFD